MKFDIRSRMLVLFALLLSLPGITKACHLAAADIYIEYAGVGNSACDGLPDYTYRVTLTVYSSCSCGSNTGANVNINYSSANAGVSQNQNIPRVLADTIDQLCPAFSAINQCYVSANDNLPAYKRNSYSGLITLPSGQSDWVFSWRSNARNQSSNLVGLGNLYIEAGMDVLAKFDNNTPRLTSNPLPYICGNQKYDYLNLPYDPDPWDSNKVLVETAVPLTGPNAPKTYVAPAYAPGRPIDNYSLDQRTGTARFGPAPTGLYTLSFKASDKYSYIYRDAQIAVFPCTAPPPYMDSVAQNVTNASLVPVANEDSTRIDSVVYVCPGSELSFDLNAWTDSATHNIYMRSDIAQFPGAQFTPVGNGGQRVTSTFDWTPTENDYGQYLLVITAVDSTCVPYQPIVLESNTVIKIWVVDGLDAGPDLKICELNPRPVQLFVKNTENLRLKWTVASGGPVIGFLAPNEYSVQTPHNPVIEYPFILGGDTIKRPVTTDYIITTIDLAGECKSADTVRVELDTTNMVKITPKNPNNEEDALVMCRPGYLQMESLIKGERPLDNLDCGISKVADCDNPESLDLFGSPIYGEANYDTSGSASPFMYMHARTGKKQFLISKEDLWNWGMRSSALKGLSFEMTGFGPNVEHDYNISISFRCVDQKELSREEGFVNFGMATVFDETVTLNDGWHDFSFDKYGPYNWDTTKNLLVQICFRETAPVPCDPNTPEPFMTYAPTTYTGGLMYSPVPATQPNLSNACGFGKVDGLVAIQARPIFKFSFCQAEPLPFDIKWVEGEFMSDSTIAQPLAYIPKSERFVVETIGLSTCIMRDTLDVYVPDLDYSITPEDTAFCLGDKAPFLIKGGGSFFKWYEYENGEYIEPVSVADPTKGATFISPQKSTEYRIVVSDSVWCYDTIAAKIEIKPLPDVKVMNEDDTVVKYGQTFQLLATGARLYNWSPVSSLNNPNISYPLARPTEDTKYIVGGIAANGCRSFDTLHVIVDKHDNLFVPSAFSPNGDGKNDVFRVTNLSFQKIMEFRVFNRWGQEIFSTTDNDRGWDGTWEGVPQGIGTYNYLIRVAYPDGFVETYKGETTLIR